MYNLYVTNMEWCNIQNETKTIIIVIIIIIIIIEGW